MFCRGERKSAAGDRLHGPQSSPISFSYPGPQHPRLPCVAPCWRLSPLEFCSGNKHTHSQPHGLQSGDRKDALDGDPEDHRWSWGHPPHTGLRLSRGHQHCTGGQFTWAEHSSLSGWELISSYFFTFSFNVGFCRSTCMITTLMECCRIALGSVCLTLCSRTRSGKRITLSEYGYCEATGLFVKFKFPQI